MAETIRLNKVLRELNISLDRAVEFLDSKGIEIDKRPTTKISEDTYKILSDEFETDANKKVKSQKVSEAKLFCFAYFLRLHFLISIRFKFV